MAAVNRNMFDASVSADPPNARGASVMVLPLNLIAQIVAHLDNPADLARVCRTCRVLNYMALPQLYRNLTLTSYAKIRYRDEQPEGWGGSSPFSMGLNAVVTRPHAELVRSMTLRGEWREHELEEYARVGRVPDSSMILNIAVRAAIDRMSELESFSWELDTKPLETVYQGLAQRPKLTSLTIRFPSSRHPRPTTVIPPMPHLRSLKVTDIDPLCYPDDLSTLLLRCKKLEELKIHWSPRMREAQEPSVMLHDYFRKCIAAKSPLRVKRLGLQNLYALHTEEFQTAFDPSTIEEVIVLNSPGIDTHMNSFVDNSWPAHPPEANFKLKSLRHDQLSRKNCDFLEKCSGLERLYFVNAIRSASDYINTPRQGSSSTMTPPTLENVPISPNGATAEASSGSTGSPHLQSPPNPLSLLRETYLNNIITYHGSTLRHLLLPSRWPLSSNSIARVVRGCPNLTQLSFAPESSTLDVLAILIPFLKSLLALRLLIPTDPSPRARVPPGNAPNGASSGSKRLTHFQSLADIVEMDDAVHIEMMSAVFTDQETNSKLKMIGIGWKAFELGGFYTIPAGSAQDVSGLYPPSLSSTVSLNQQPRIVPVDSPSQPSVSPTSATRPDGEPVTIPSTPTPFPTSPVPRPAKSTVQSPKSSLGKHPRDADSQTLLPDQKRQSAFDTAVCFSNVISKSAKNPEAQKLIWRRRVRRVGWEVLQHWEIWSLDIQEM
ncbi:conserved hypothetical protein [Paecilomyces variotii No. 5]|uniref:F-box domain-containing protein n=1 Tax=Byssochlamys spectabilis (strain No. 5 / NBRC 109023) TaxID=1356009 RepID=V5FX37_BYSSN|nr:conserved hypothetical protein [Paecilomyces variotii No. 5]